MFTLPGLNYSFDALEPFIDAKTMEIHHDKHHSGYVEKLNKALEGYEDLQDKSIEDLLKDIDSVPMDIEVAVRNNGGGHANHSLFWTIMKPKAGGNPSGVLAKAIDDTFTSFETFKEEFSAAAAGQFGSGWAWLTLEQGKLHVCSTPNQDSPYMKGNVPVLGLDVWEHAYYLHYQNKRVDYIQAWWNVVDWDEVERRYKEAIIAQS
jgi:Fe-Mn family superoxide dismutase